MSERATAYRIATPSPAPTTGSELAVRPKVLRRPAHFGSKPPVEAPTPVLIPLQADNVEVRPVSASSRAWQDDGKFAITLLAIVIIVNLVVSGWLAVTPSAPMPPAKPPTVPTAPLDTAPAAAPVHELENPARAISEQ